MSKIPPCPNPYRRVPVNPQDPTDKVAQAVNLNLDKIEKAFEDLRICTASKLNQIGTSGGGTSTAPVPVTVDVIAGPTNFELEWSQGYSEVGSDLMTYVDPRLSGIYWFTPDTTAITDRTPCEWPTHIATTNACLQINIQGLSIGPHTTDIDIVLTINNVATGIGVFSKTAGSSTYSTGDIALALSVGDTVGLMCRINRRPSYPAACPGPDNSLYMTARFDAYNGSATATIVTAGVPGPAGPIGLTGASGAPGGTGATGATGATGPAGTNGVTLGVGPVMTYPFVFRRTGSGSAVNSGVLFFLLPATADATLQQFTGSPEYQVGPVIAIASTKCFVTVNVQRNAGASGTWYLFKNPTDSTIQSDAIASGSIATAFSRTISGTITVSLAAGDSIGMVINDFGSSGALEVQITVITLA